MTANVTASLDSTWPLPLLLGQIFTYLLHTFIAVLLLVIAAKWRHNVLTSQPPPVPLAVVEPPPVVPRKFDPWQDGPQLDQTEPRKTPKARQRTKACSIGPIYGGSGAGLRREEEGEERS